MIYTELHRKCLKIPKVVIRSRRWKKNDNATAKRTHIDLQYSFTCAGLKYFVDIIMRSLLFPYANAEYVTSISVIFVNKKTEPLFVNSKLHRLFK